MMKEEEIGKQIDELAEKDGKQRVTRITSRPLLCIHVLRSYVYRQYVGENNYRVRQRGRCSIHDLIGSPINARSLFLFRAFIHGKSRSIRHRTCNTPMQSSIF